ncbi:helix-turn-helix domain-containing protein [uncultured Jatrophihabitans sp.]|uniref:helix-turn-helix domain-containing protein n=1 Tax=uncultured Jatrophihabitans sp. TaxID=1610747 RepID=UPI0035CB5507
MDAGSALRAARRWRRLSQRQLADVSGVPRQTIERIEAGGTSPRVNTLDTLLRSVGYELVVENQFGRRLRVDDREHPRDRAGRHLPAHLPFIETRELDVGEGWWGWWRIAWSRRDPTVPEYTYWQPRQPRRLIVGDRGSEFTMSVWDDAT